jgi:hypothetical protein
MDMTRLLLLCAALLSPSAAAQGLVYHVDGNSANDDFGTSVAPIGDLNGDGRIDFLVGAPREFGSGTAFVRSGLDGSQLFRFVGDVVGDRFGHAVAGAGDVDGDGHPDAIVGAPDNANAGPDGGMVRMFSGRDGSVIRSIDGPTANDRFGRSVGGGGDADADGYDDVVVGAPVEFGTGTAHVLSGRNGSSIWRFNGDAIGDEFGHSVAFVGDVDGDGFADIAVGAHLNANSGPNGGLVRVFSGRTGNPLYTVDAPSADDRFGYSVRGAGDVDLNGVPDVLVGAPVEFGTGTAFVLDGRTGAVLRKLHGDDIGDRFGHSVGGAGDVDGDGYADFLVGAPEDDDTGANAGSVRLLSGRTGAPLRTWFGDAAGDQFGFDVALVDVDGDGFEEAVGGVPFSDVGGPESGRVSVYDHGAAGTPARVRAFGNGCPGSNGKLPRSDHRGRPFLGRTIDILLRGGTSNRAVLISFAARESIALGAFGYPGCHALALTNGAFLSGVTDANGMAALRGIPIPNAPILIGVALACQWVVGDRAANAGGATTSNGLELVFGN